MDNKKQHTVKKPSQSSIKKNRQWPVKETRPLRKKIFQIMYPLSNIPGQRQLERYYMIPQTYTGVSII